MHKGVIWFGSWLMLAVTTSAGCGSASLAPVEGRVTLDGKPLANATVTFSQVLATAPGPYTATTDNDGRFALGPVGQERAGAAPGEYFVFITTVKQAAGGMEDTPLPTQREIVPAAFRNGSKRIEVTGDGNKEANFEMKSR